MTVLTRCETIGDGYCVFRMTDDGDVGAPIGEQRRRRQADAGASAQYERRLSFEFPIERG